MAEPVVAVVRDASAVLPDGTVDRRRVEAMIERAFRALAGGAAAADFARRVVPAGARVGIKINTIGGPRISTRPETAFALASALAAGGASPARIAVWDRTNRELKSAGYRLAAEGAGPLVFGTDTDGVGYDPDLTEHLEIGSRFSALQSAWAAVSVSLAILKDHGVAGVTAGMKNYFGAVHNPNKYHDTGCDPYVAQLFSSAPVRGKHRLTVVDALTVQYHRGPSYHASWADRSGTIIAGADPVACDRVGWDLIERLRARKGLPSLAEENRAPRYLATAKAMGLGEDDLSKIRVIEASA